MSAIYNALIQFLPSELAIFLLVAIAILAIFLVFKIVKIVLDSLPFL